MTDAYISTEKRTRLALTERIEQAKKSASNTDGDMVVKCWACKHSGEEEHKVFSIEYRFNGKCALNNPNIETREQYSDHDYMHRCKEFFNPDLYEDFLEEYPLEE